MTVPARFRKPTTRSSKLPLSPSTSSARSSGTWGSTSDEVSTTRRHLARKPHACRSIATAFIGDILGRRRTIVLGACLVLLGTVLQAVAGLGTLWVLVAGRVAAGLGIGVNTATIPVWQSEMARSEWRGTLVMTEGALVRRHRVWHL